MLEVYHGFITKFITDLSRNLSHITVLCSSHARSVQAHSAHACLAHACLAHVSLSPRFARPTLCSCHALHSRTTHARGLHATVSQLGFPTHQHAPAPLTGGQLHASATCGRTQCRRHLRANDRTLPGVAGPHAGGGAEKHRVLGVLAHRTPVQWGVFKSPRVKPSTTLPSPEGRGALVMPMTILRKRTTSCSLTSSCPFGQCLHFEAFNAPASSCVGYE